MNYGDIVSRGWHITWNNKFLWVLGFFAALAKVSSNFSNSNSYSGSGPESVDIEQVVAMTTVVLAATCFFMLIGLLLWLLSLVAKGGLITAVARIDAGETTNLKESFAAGTAKIWSLIGMNLLLLLPVIVAVIVGIAGMIFILAGSGITAAALVEQPTAFEDAIASSVGIFLFCICGLVCGLILFGFFIQFVNAFAYRGIMLQDMGAIESISHGWQVFKTNVGEVILLCLIFFGIALLYGLVLAVIMVPLALVMVIPLVALMTEGGGVAIGSLIALIVSLLCLGIIGAGLNSILTTWQSASFTLAYQEWINKPKADTVTT